MPTPFWGSMFFGARSPILINSSGELFISVSDAYSEPQSYYLRLADDSMELEAVYSTYYELVDGEMEVVNKTEHIELW